VSFMTEYKNKLITAAEAAALVKSGDWVDFGALNGQIHLLDRALAERVDELKDVKMWSILSLRYPEILKADKNNEAFIWHSWHYSGMDRQISGERPVYYSSIRYSELPRYVREHIEPIDVAMMQTGPMDKHGFFNFGPQNSHSKAICERARIVVVEVNEKMPRCLGGFEEAVHISQVDYIVEGENPSMVNYTANPATEADKKAAAFILEEISDGACIQLGIGGSASATGEMIAASDLKDLGCHTEMLHDSYVDMYNAGRITGLRKGVDPGKMSYAFALGTQKLYDFIDDNPVCASFPVNYTNDPSIAALNDNLITVNGAIEVDLYGQVCSESSGTRMISGTGGQLDFVLAGYKSRGGKSFICLPAANIGKDGKLKTRIVPIITPGGIVTDPRSTAHFVVTEYGKFSLKGMAAWQRAEGLIGIAHPDARDELIKAAEKQGIWRRSNKLY
jgi:butyryl-CoA:acetate CoA-transferase